MTYLNENSPEAFVDYPPAPRHPLPAGMVTCPRCKGHGGWNLKLNSYKLPDGMEDTPENRHKYVNFRASCSNCNGWGYVRADSRDATCIHKYEHSANVGNCLNNYKCSKCEKEICVDSSD
jgi:hypothetical protein